MGIGVHQGSVLSPLLFILVLEVHSREFHVQKVTSYIKSITNFPLPGTRKKGRPGKTWSECVKTDVDMCGLAGIDPLDRDAWRAGA